MYMVHVVPNSQIQLQFLYIGILELGTKELLICRDDPHGSGLVMDHEKGKLVALVFGFAVMALLALWL